MSKPKKKLTLPQANAMLAKSYERHADPKDLDYMPASYDLFAEETRRFNEKLQKTANRRKGAQKAAATRRKNQQADVKKKGKKK